ncbi:phosphate/phosphite/phosphonate ABC transporter substrate-binding protein [Methanomethylovorans sp.]|uniref:phosphate/phosphite/phosphonate ABC transporter substrate-binding protein n=1 Tax=Methanomethylovorans sp. TaxID=2758717 RepID=UPI00351C07C7
MPMLTGRNLLTVLIKISSLFFLLVLLFSSLASSEENIVNIGVMVRSDSIHTMDKWNFTVDHLNSESDTSVFKLVPMEFNNFSKIEANEIDFIICNPWMYVETENKYGITRIATQKNVWESKPYTMHGAVFITRVNRTDVNSLEDLRAKSFMYVDNASFASYLITLHELQQKGLEHSLFGKVSFGGNSSAIVFAVRDGKVDSGAIRTGTLELMDARGLINIEDFKVLDQQHVENFPFLLIQNSILNGHLPG